jgi:hypothetical protein
MGNPIRVEPEDRPDRLVEDERHAQVRRDIGHTLDTYWANYLGLMAHVSPNSAEWYLLGTTQIEHYNSIQARYSIELHLHRVQLLLIENHRVNGLGPAPPVHRN